MAVAPETRGSDLSGLAHPSPIPSVLLVPEELRRSDDILEVNFGRTIPPRTVCCASSSSSTARPWSACAR